MTSPVSSELEHSAALFAALSRAGRLLSTSSVGAPAGPRAALDQPQTLDRPQAPESVPVPLPPEPRLPEPVESGAPIARPPARPVATMKAASIPPADLPPVTGSYRSDRMAAILMRMCKRGGFSGAVVADRGGLPLSEFNTPVELELMAALGSILGSSLEQAARLLQRPDANNLSIDVNYVDKIVLRTFLFEGLPYHLLVICPQAVDERSEVELSIEQIQSVLSHET